MKLISAVIKPSRLDAVLEAVTEAGDSGLTVTVDDCEGLERAVKRIAAAQDARASPTVCPSAK